MKFRLCITTKTLKQSFRCSTQIKLHTQLSQKLKRFRGCRGNKKCSIFHELSEYIQIMATFSRVDWFFKVLVHFVKLLKLHIETPSSCIRLLHLEAPYAIGGGKLCSRGTVPITHPSKIFWPFIHPSCPKIQTIF